MGLQPTGNYCIEKGCNGSLIDNAIDWDTPLPEDKFEQFKKEVRKADLIICLGTSLRIRPAGNIPNNILNKNRKTPGRLVIINLQKTHLDMKDGV